jgi:hypothetical protein
VLGFDLNMDLDENGEIAAGEGRTGGLWDVTTWFLRLQCYYW